MAPLLSSAPIHPSLLPITNLPAANIHLNAQEKKSLSSDIDSLFESSDKKSIKPKESEKETGTKLEAFGSAPRKSLLGGLPPLESLNSLRNVKSANVLPSLVGLNDNSTMEIMKSNSIDSYFS